MRWGRAKAQTFCRSCCSCRLHLAFWRVVGKPEADRHRFGKALAALRWPEWNKLAQEDGAESRRPTA